jgi:hypothetical protein
VNANGTPSIYELGAAVGAQEADALSWDVYNLDAPLFWQPFTTGMRLLSPLHRRYSAESADWEDYARSYWAPLHGNPDPNTPPSGSLEWLTVRVWRAVVERIGARMTEMPKPSEVLNLCLLARGAIPPDPTKKKALARPEAGAESLSSARIRQENMLRLRRFHKATNAASAPLMARGGVRDQIVSQCQREGLTGDRLRLTIALRMAEEILRRPRPVMPTFLSDAGREGVGREEAERWNTKADLDQKIGDIRAELAQLDADDAEREAA